MLETLDYTIRIGSTPTILYFDLYYFQYILFVILPFCLMPDCFTLCKLPDDFTCQGGAFRRVSVKWRHGICAWQVPSWYKPLSCASKLVSLALIRKRRFFWIADTWTRKGYWDAHKRILKLATIMEEAYNNLPCPTIPRNLHGGGGGGGGGGVVGPKLEPANF